MIEIEKNIGLKNIGLDEMILINIHDKNEYFSSKFEE